MTALAVCQAYLGYSRLLEQLPPEVDYTDAQGARLIDLARAVRESRPLTLAELAAKTAALARFYEGSETTVAFESIVADIRRLAGE